MTPYQFYRFFIHRMVVRIAVETALILVRIAVSTALILVGYVLVTVWKAITIGP